VFKPTATYSPRGRGVGRPSLRASVGQPSLQVSVGRPSLRVSVGRPYCSTPAVHVGE